jgi:hypothetical protein
VDMRTGSGSGATPKRRQRQHPYAAPVPARTRQRLRRRNRFARSGSRRTKSSWSSSSCPHVSKPSSRSRSSFRPQSRQQISTSVRPLRSMRRCPDSRSSRPCSWPHTPGGTRSTLARSRHRATPGLGRQPNGFLDGPSIGSWLPTSPSSRSSRSCGGSAVAVHPWRPRRDRRRPSAVAGSRARLGKRPRAADSRWLFYARSVARFLRYTYPALLLTPLFEEVSLTVNAAAATRPTGSSTTCSTRTVRCSAARRR